MGIVTSRTYTARPGRTAACSACSEETPRNNNRLAVTDYNQPEDLSDSEHEAEEPEAEEETDPEKPKPPPRPRRKRALKVKDVDLNVSTNAKKHHTDDYEICENHLVDGRPVPPQLVIRRGETFDFKVTLNKPYNKEVDVVRIVFEVGGEPLNSKGTRVPLLVDKGIKPRHWSACCNCDGTEMTVTILPPANCIIGKWNMVIETVLQDEDDEVVHMLRYKHQYPIYVLFNPWCKEDEVYMENSTLRDETVLNDKGKIYSGNYKQIGSKPWNFGQFEEEILDCVLYLMDMVNKPESRCSAIDITRAVSAFVNAPDDGGVLVGNWSGNYEGGTAPTKWVGSVAILRQFWETKESVLYGQCWVFSGLCTTVCRALGIPSRSVTNFASAHDCDGSVTIDKHLDEDNEPIGHLNNDSVWNFHVWNEAWMARPDLPPGYGGWQAFDATPQETSSNGIYCAGPASVRAIKQGDISLPYDTRFIFAEVNADRLYWKRDRYGDFEVSSTMTSSVGKNISTKELHSNKRLDVTDLYKYPEGSSEERASVYRAGLKSRRPTTYDTGKNDVKFEFEDRDGILVGNDFELLLKVQNTSRETRTVFVRMTLSSVYYTGVHKAVVKKLREEVKLGPIQTEEVTMRVSTDEYLPHVVDQVSFKIAIMAHVEETKQNYNDDDDFRLRRPDLEIEVPDKVTVNESFDCVIKLQNSMPIHLTNCSWLVEGAKLLPPTKFEEKDLGPHDRAEIKVTLTAKKKGLRTIMASFDSKELQDITGEFDISVVD